MVTVDLSDVHNLHTNYRTIMNSSEISEQEYGFVNFSLLECG